MLKLRSLQSGYGNLRVLKGISLHVAPGEIVTIIGANGAGKTTLLHTIMGIVKKESGELEFNGRIIHHQHTADLVKNGCCLVPEGRQVFAPMTVRENLTLGGYTRFSRTNRSEYNAALNEVFSLFPRLEERKKQLAGTLSGGEQQMLAIGRALMSGPELLMLDEPSMGLAPLIVKDIFNTISRLRDKGKTILLVEQNASSALKIADRGYVIETGRIVLEGTASELLVNNEVQRAYLGKDYKNIDDPDINPDTTE